MMHSVYYKKNEKVFSFPYHCFVYCCGDRHKEKTSTKHPQSGLRLYWFIPDGMRADPDLFNVFRWAKEGKLPNIKKLMDRGSYGYSYPNFPSHTPTNFATLLTGAYPEIHGVNDGPMHALDKPSGQCRRWRIPVGCQKSGSHMENARGCRHESLPYLDPWFDSAGNQQGVVVRGRWGGWGPDFAAINFETKGNLSQRIKQGRGRDFLLWSHGSPSIRTSRSPRAGKWLRQVILRRLRRRSQGGGPRSIRICMTQRMTERINYNRVAFSFDKKNIVADLSQGEWSNWTPITLKWKSESQSVDVKTSAKIAVIKLGPDNFYRFRVFYDNLNEHAVFP